MASCLSSAIDSSEHHIGEIPNAINPDMSALATVSKDTEIESLLTNSQEELIMRDLHKRQNSIIFTTVKFIFTSKMFINVKVNI